jgi:predicted RNase H-like nuclease (RuvC/YqgF family)
MERLTDMEYESNEDILCDLMDNVRNLHEENARLMQEVDQLKEENKELNRKLKSIQALFL